MRVDEHRCDRCGKKLGTHQQLNIVVQYHHPRTLEFCPECEGAFTIWLGKHPHSGVPLADILAGRASGAGYPSFEQLDAYRATQAARPTAQVLACLAQALAAVVSSDNLRGGGRDFGAEQRQEDAKKFLQALEVTHEL